MKLKKAILFILLFCFSLLVFSSVIYSKLGVGVGSGTITIDEDLKPGMVYKFPNLVVFNTGDEASDYMVDVAYKTDQEQLRVPREWIKFSPEEFYLEPDESQSVEISLVLPFKAEPGDYFAFLQGKPVVKEAGGASINIAAASKLYFTVEPANVLAAVYYRGVHFWQDYYPYSAIIAGVAGGGLLIVSLKKLLGVEIDIQLGKKKKPEPEAGKAESEKKN